MTLRITRIVLHARDMDRQLAFWRDLMGLPSKDDSSDPTVAELDAGPCSLLLLKGGKPGDLEYAPRITLYSDDVPELHEELELLGIKVGKLKQFGDHQAFDATDPEGNPFQISNRP